MMTMAYVREEPLRVRRSLARAGPCPVEAGVILFIAALLSFLQLAKAQPGGGSPSRLPVVAIHDSELTRALESMPASGATPTGPGTTGYEWWPTNWHYFVMPEALKEALRSDGTAFAVVSDADIRAGRLLDTNGLPVYPILFSLAAEAVGDDEIAPLTNYVAAGGFLLAGSSSFTRNTNGTTRGDFAFANELGVHMVRTAVTNWGLNSTFMKATDHRLIGHIPAGTLTWRLPFAAEEICWGTSPTHTFLAPHLAWQVQASNATVLAQGDVYPYLLTKPFGQGQFIYHASMQPMLGVGGFTPTMYGYLIFRKAIEWAFEAAKLPVPRLSPWPYPYDAAFMLRRDLEDYTNEVAAIAASALIDYTNGARGDYYFCTGTLREDAGASYDTNSIIAGLRLAVSNYGATIGPHNGGLKNPNNPDVTRGQLDYWHWGPDEALDVTPANYLSGKVYALTSISNSFQDVEGWLSGLTNGLRIWASCYFNATREDSYDIEAQLGVNVTGEQKITPFPHWTLSTRTWGKHYAFLSEPTSDWFVDGLVAQSLEPWHPPGVHTSQTLHSAVDFYYNLGGLINFYSHTLSTGLGDAGPLALDYITYSLNTNLHPRLWSANAASVYQWWLQRSNAHISASCTNDGSQSVTTLVIAGATDTNTAVELLVPGCGTALGLQVFTNGVLASGDGYRTNGNVIRVWVGSSVSTVQVRYVLAPGAQDDSYSATTNTILTLAPPGLLANDTTGSGTNLTAVLVSAPVNGRLNLSSDGSFSYTPTNGFVGTDSFTYQANDGVANSSTATVTLRVLPVGTLFADDFVRLTDPGPLLPWIAQAGNWTVTGGLMRGGTNTLGTYGYACLTNVWTNYSVQAQMQFPLGAYGGGLSAGLNPLTGARYAAWIYPEGSPGGSNLLKLIKFQTWTGFGYNGTNNVPMQQLSVAAVGTNWHTVKLVLLGRQLAVYYDGNRLISATDVELMPYASGGVSLEMWTAATPYFTSIRDLSVISAPAPIIGAIRLSGTTATITWSAVPSQCYRVQYQDGLRAGTWNDWLPEVTATNITATADLVIEPVSRRAYRVMLVP
jgi:hypothetical protein